MSQDPKPKRTLRVERDGNLCVPGDIVAAQGLRPGDQVDGVRLHRKMEQPASSPLRPIVYTIVLGSIGALGGLLIDWPLPFVGFSMPAMWIYLAVFLSPLGYIVITWMVKRKRPCELAILISGLFYGGLLWSKVILEVFWGIHWPLPFIMFPIQAVWINLTAFLFPLAYIFITWMARRKRSPREFLYLLLGLFYGSVLWLQVILEVFLRTSLKLGEREEWDYLQSHAYDLFAVAAIVGAVGYFIADRRRIVRIVSLATVFAVTGGFTGFTEAEYLWEKGGLNQFNYYPYWVLPFLWALTGIWYGLCVGFLAPEEVLARLREEPES